MDKETKMMLNTILEEMSRTEERIYTRIDTRFDNIEAHLDSLRHKVNACKLERESISRCVVSCGVFIHVMPSLLILRKL